MTFRAVIVEGGQTILILQTSPATVIAGIAQKQVGLRSNGKEALGIKYPLQCNNKTFRGAYGFIAEGVAGPPTLPAGVGTVTFERDSTFVLTATRNTNGVLDPEPVILKGTYVMNSDCTFAMTFEVGFTFSATIVNGGQEILFVETDPGTAIIVKAKRI